MWKDIGLSDWLFDFDNEEEIKRFVPAVLKMAKDPREAKTKAARAKTFVTAQQAATMKWWSGQAGPLKSKSVKDELITVLVR